ncbi:MAG: ABC transporter ATP-binding protein [Bacteroidia bacterium]
MLLQIQNLHKSYQQVHVLKGINMQVNKGEIISIVGASGAGKTTLLQIIGTLDKADTGSINFEGTNMMQLQGKQLATFRNQKLGFIFQFHNLLPEFTALENVCIPAFIAKKSKKESEKKAAELLEFLNLSSRASHKPSELSGGEQQRVAVARALINNPSLLLADEPSGNLDSQNAKELHDLFFKLRNQFNQTFIIVTHNAGFADMADRKLTIKDGVIE